MLPISFMPACVGSFHRYAGTRPIMTLNVARMARRSNIGLASQVSGEYPGQTIELFADFNSARSTGLLYA